MLSITVWAGLIIFFVGTFGLITGIVGISKSVVLTVVGTVAWTWGVFWFGYFKDVTRPSAPAERAGQLPTALALAFEDATPAAVRRAGKLVPGKANEEIAAWLRANASLFDRILTQEAIMVALFGADARDGTSINGTPVYRMHRHDGKINIRTLESLSCALRRLKTPNQGSKPLLVLVAHDKQYERAREDLEWLEASIVESAVPKMTQYKTNNVLEPYWWARRELFFARPIEFLQRRFLSPAGGCCRTTICLETIRR